MSDRLQGVRKMKNLIFDQLPYSVNDRVWHATPGGPKGIIGEVRFYASMDQAEYMVSWGPGTREWVYDNELSREEVPDLSGAKY